IGQVGRVGRSISGLPFFCLCGRPTCPSCQARPTPLDLPDLPDLPDRADLPDPPDLKRPYFVPVDGPGLIGIMMCAPGVPGSISHGLPLPFSAASRWLSVETPTESGVAFGTDITHSSLMRPGSSE